MDGRCSSLSKTRGILRLSLRKYCQTKEREKFKFAWYVFLGRGRAGNFYTKTRPAKNVFAWAVAHFLQPLTQSGRFNSPKYFFKYNIYGVRLLCNIFRRSMTERLYAASVYLVILLEYFRLSAVTVIEWRFPIFSLAVTTEAGARVNWKLSFERFRSCVFGLFSVRVRHGIAG